VGGYALFWVALGENDHFAPTLIDVRGVGYTPMSTSHDPIESVPACARQTGLDNDAVDPAAGATRELQLLELVRDERSVTAEGAPTLPLFEELSVREAVRYFCRRRGRMPRTKHELQALLSQDIAELDSLMSRQVNGILHHPRFQRLEAAWRGVYFLVTLAARGENVEIRVLDIDKRQLYDDLTTALDFDQSALFKLIYESEFGTAGGTPYGVLIADYYFSNAPNDIELLKAASGVAASAFCPFIAGVDSKMFGIDDFQRLPRLHKLESYFGGERFVKWRALRNSEDARFIGLVLPQVLMRLPYVDDTLRSDGFIFREDVADKSSVKYLWGNAAFAFGGVLIQAFVEHRWFADLRGAHRDGEKAGRVEGLPVHSFATDTTGVAIKSSVMVSIDGNTEKQLSGLGFIPLCDAPDTEFSVFYSNQSLQRPRRYSEEEARINAKLSAMLQYVMCASRFAHYLRVLGRRHLGGATDAKSLQAELHRWVHQYVSRDPTASRSIKAKFPLRQAEVEVRNHPGEPGHFITTFFLRPHFQLDELTASIKLVSKL